MGVDEQIDSSVQ